MRGLFRAGWGVRLRSSPDYLSGLVVSLSGLVVFLHVLVCCNRGLLLGAVFLDLLPSSTMHGRLP